MVQGGGWGGRRHGFRRSGKSVTVTVVLTDLESSLLERLQKEKLREGHGDSTVRLKGKWSQGAVVRLAIRELARAEGLMDGASGGVVEGQPAGVGQPAAEEKE